MSSLFLLFNWRRGLAIHWLTLGILLLAFLLPGKAVSAHPADMYAQEEAITISSAGLSVDWKITPGPMLAGVLWDQADTNHDGKISPDEALAWFRPIAPQWQLVLDGHPLDAIQVSKIHWPASMDILAAGDEPIEIQFLANWPVRLQGSSPVVIHDNFQEAISLNWFSLKSQTGVVFAEPAQNNGLLQTTVYFSENNSDQNHNNITLTSWVSGKPSIPGLTGAISSAAASLASTGQSGETISSQANPISSLLSLVRTQNATPAFLLGACLLSLVLGSLHALTPGHGKALVAAYLVGSQGRTRDAVFLGSVVTITHTGSVLLLGLVTLVASRYILPSLVIPWLDLLSGLFVVTFGINLLVRRGRSFLAWRRTQHRRPSAASISQIKVAEAGTGLRQPLTHTHEAGQAHTHGTGQPHSHLAGQIHTHDHALEGHTHRHGGHELVHTLPGNQVTWKSLLSLGISGGLVPCPDAIAILLVAVAVNRIPFGMLLIVAFSTGLALVLIGIGIAMVQGFRFINRSEWVNRFSLYTPVISAAAVLVLGIGLTWTALNGGFLSPVVQSANGSGTLSAATGGPPTVVSGFLTGINRTAGRAQSGMAVRLSVITPVPTFDLQKARLAYVASDSQHEDQLYVIPLSDGAATAYTQEPAGILDYHVSQDKKTLMYSVLNPGGDSAIWGMAIDGTQRHLILSCPHAECSGAVWSPDNQSLVYERHDYTSTSAIPLLTIWWLNLKTGETQPVFRDGSFPSYSPSFSTDGQWLSYITPTNNTLQVFNLQNGRNQSIPYRSGMPEIWSPTDNSLLYWDQLALADRTIYRLKRYVLATGKTIDLSGSADQEDYSAVWSPDGQWIAVIRSDLKSNSTSDQERVWMVKPDGSQAYPILSQQGVSYEDLSWAPDGRTLAYQLFSSQDNQRVAEIWMVDIQTRKQTRIVSGGSQPVFLP